MSKYNILWIDDDVNGPELMSERDAMEERGCTITPVSHPDQLRIDTINSYDCIIMDLSMPIGSSLSIQETRGGSRTGFVLLKKIKQKYPSSKMVVYTVFGLPEVKSYCRDNNIEYWNKSSLLADDFAEKLIKYIKGE